MFQGTSCMPFNLVAGVACGSWLRTSVGGTAALVAWLVPWLNFAMTLNQNESQELPAFIRPIVGVHASWFFYAFRTSPSCPLDARIAASKECGHCFLLGWSSVRFLSAVCFYIPRHLVPINYTEGPPAQNLPTLLKVMVESFLLNVLGEGRCTYGSLRCFLQCGA